MDSQRSSARLTRRAFGVGALGLAAAAQPLAGRAAEAFPTRPLWVIVPTTPGSTTDIMARAFAQQLTKAYGQPASVDNKAGATGVIGTQFVARAKPDGYTLLVGPGSTMVVNPLVSSAPYDTLKDFRIIGLLCKAETVIVANPARGFRNLRDVIQYARHNPGKLAYGSSGNGSTLHLAMELLQMQTGTEMLHIPYKGTAPAETAVMADEVALMLSNTSSVAAHIKAGKLVPIAITSTLPWRELRGVQLASETVPDYSVDTWLGVYVPAAVNDEVAASLNATLDAFLRDPETVEMMRSRGFAATPGTQEDARRFLAKEVQQWSRIVAAAKAAGRLQAP